MDFFVAQQRSQARARRLLLWFVPAILFLFAGAHLISALAFRAIPYDLIGDLHPLYTTDADLRHSMRELLVNSRVILAGQVPMLLLLLATIGLRWRELNQAGADLLMKRLKARRLSGFNHPLEQRFRNVVGEMAIAAGLAVPSLYVLDGEEGINALCAGLGPGEAAIAVTRGALESLTRDELQGLAGHEIGHIINGDLPFNMKLASLINGFTQVCLSGLNVAALSGAAVFVAGALLFSNNPLGGLLIMLAFLFLLLGALILVVGGIGLILGRAAQQAIVREGEFAADARAVQFARLSSGLAGALSRAMRDNIKYGRKSMPHSSVRHMLLLDETPGWLATHPPIERRLERLGEIPIEPADGGIRRVPGGPSLPTLRLDSEKDARACVYAVLLLDNQGEVEPSLRMLAGVEPPEIALRTGEFYRQMQGHDIKAAQMALATALPELSVLEGKDRAKILRNAERLALGDGDMSAHEEGFIGYLRKNLQPNRPSLSADRESQIRAMGLVVSWISQQSDESGQVFALAQERLAGIRGLKLRDTDDIPPWELAVSLDILKTLTLEEKQTLMAALKNVSMQDGVIKEKEQDILTLVSKTLDVEIPETVYDGSWH